MSSAYVHGSFSPTLALRAAWDPASGIIEERSPLLETLRAITLTDI